MGKSLAGKKALITGGVHRVGGAITLALAEAGVECYITYNNSGEEAIRMMDVLRSELNTSAYIFHADLSDLHYTTKLIDRIEDCTSKIDILVNSADTMISTPIIDFSYPDWSNVMNTGLYSPIIITDELIRRKMLIEGGNIINIIDSTYHRPVKYLASHSVVKGALCALTRSMAVEFAPFIRANAIELGYIIPPVGKSKFNNEFVADKNLIGKWGGGDEVGLAVRYLAESDFVTGSILTVDGGEGIKRL